MATPTPPVVDNLPLPQATAPDRQAAAAEKLAIAADLQARAFAATTGFSGNALRDEFKDLLVAAMQARVATDINGLLKFAGELQDGIELKYPTPAAAEAPAPTKV